MKQITLEESKEIQVNILSFVDQFCRKHNIRYSLYGGTLIGAIRHKGFIPWDDDIDIILPREDYNNLINSFNDENGIYVLHSLENDINYCYPYAKIEDSRTLLKEGVATAYMGIAIDVFPCDYVGNTKEEAIRFIKKREITRVLYLSKLVIPSNRNAWYKRIFTYCLKALLTLVNTRTLAKIRSRQAQVYKERTNYIADVVLTPNYGIREIQPSEFFDSYVDVEFEGLRFRSIKEYDVYLRSVYGDYMQLPPEDKRVSPHTITEMFWKD